MESRSWFVSKASFVQCRFLGRLHSQFILQQCKINYVSVKICKLIAAVVAVISGNCWWQLIWAEFTEKARLLCWVIRKMTLLSITTYRLRECFLTDIMLADLEAIDYFIRTVGLFPFAIWMCWMKEPTQCLDYEKDFWWMLISLIAITFGCSMQM